MKNKKGMRRLLMALLTLALLCVGGTSVSAAKAALVPETLWENCEYWGGVGIKNVPKNAKLVSLTSSKPSVIEPWCEAGKPVESMYTSIRPKKAGVSKITLTYKVGTKKTSISALYTVKKYPSPFKSVKVNGIALNIQKYPYYYDYYNYNKGTAKIQLTLKSGWKIDTENSTKNNVTIPTPKGQMTSTFFVVKNSKGESVQYGIRFYRQNANNAKIRVETLFAGSVVSPSVQLENVPMGYEIVKVTSAKPSVIEIVGNTCLNAKKVGTSKITVTFKAGGKTYTKSAVYTVKKYPNPFKSITVNGAKVNLKQNAYSAHYSNYKKSTATVKFTPNAGWKVDSIYGQIMKKNYEYLNGITVANGKAVKCEKNRITHIGVSMKNTKGEVFRYIIEFVR